MAEIIIMPKLGFDMAEGTLVRWLKSEGEEVAQGDVIAEIETDKATVEVESNYSGIFLQRIAEEGASVPIGSPIAIVGAADEEVDLESLLRSADAGSEASVASQPPETEKVVPVESKPERAGDGRLPSGVHASPIARRLAKEHGIDLQALTGSGPGGRIVKSDVEAFLSTPVTGMPTDVASLTPSLPLPQSIPTDEVENTEIPLSKLRSLIGQRMTAAKQQVPHFYLTSALDAGPLMNLRNEMNMRVPEAEKFSVNDFMIKAAALALRQFPSLNASLLEGRIIRHGQINIGIAVAVDGGLLTVVVRDVDKKPLRLIAHEARSAIQRARSGRVQPDDLQGSTFTVSNLGMFDIDNFIAIINPPEAAILAVGSVSDVPVVQDGELVPGKQVKVTLSADHRVTDGAEAAQWLQIFKSMVEDPLRLLL